MPAFLERDLLTVAFCWRLERLDGIVLGFTTHDRDLSRGGARSGSQLLTRSAPSW